MSVRRFFGFVLGGNRFRQCNDATVLFVFAAALLHKEVDLVMLSMHKNEVHGVIKDSTILFPSST